MIILCSPRSYYKKRKVRKQITEYSISDNLKYRKIKERKELKGKKKSKKKKRRAITSSKKPYRYCNSGQNDRKKREREIRRRIINIVSLL